MFDNVIVPYDGSVPGRAVLAPAGDLAWRSGGRVVLVQNTDVADEESRARLKQQAMSQSGADMDFWVDANVSLGRAALDAAAHRAAPVLCVSGKGRPSRLRLHRGLPGVAEEVLAAAPCPVLVVGPEADVSRGLPMTEALVALDGSASSETILPLGVDLARSLRLRLVLVGVVPEGDDDHAAERQYLERALDQARPLVPEASFELVEAPDPASGLLRILTEREDAVMAMSTHGRSGTRRGPLGAVAERVVAESPRALLLQRPDASRPAAGRDAR